MKDARKLPGSLDTNRMLERWLRINRDGTVTVHTGKVEIGQGILTALAQIVAEELDVEIARIRLETATTAHSPDEGITSGSRSIEESGVALRYAAAQARQLLLERGAARLGSSIERVTVSDGEMSAGGAVVTYWELADDDLLRGEAAADAAFRPAAEQRYIGTSVPRRDIPAKITGNRAYVQDIELQGMVYGRVVRPPHARARLAVLDDTEARAMPGVLAIVRDGSFVGVIAEREEQAIRAARCVARLAQWEKRGEELPAGATTSQFLQSQAARSEVISEKDAPAGDASVVLEARYSRPYLAHASLAPSCAVAQFRDGKYQVWTHSQGIYPLRHDLARALGVQDSAVIAHHMESAGCYGHNGADDVALDAALLARSVPERPVHVQWMREDEFGWEPLGPAMAAHARASLDAAGRVVDWAFEVWSYPHSTRPGSRDGVNLLAAWHLAEPVAAGAPGNPPLPAGGSHRNAIPLYEFPRQRVTNHLVLNSPLRTSALRALGAHMNIFAIECFMDELAVAAEADPVEFRLRHLKDPRARAVIEQVAAMCDWHDAQPRTGTRGRGIGFARYKNLGCYVAVVAEIDAETELRVTRVWAAVDAGLVINPDGVLNQIEGGVVQAISMSMREQVAFDQDGVTSRNWNDYPILKFSEVPAIRVELLSAPGQPPVGAGEGALGPTAAAIGNAVYNGLGARVRDMPITRERVIAALA